MDEEWIPIVDRLNDSLKAPKYLTEPNFPMASGRSDFIDGVNVFINAPPEGLANEYQQLFSNDAVEFMVDLVLRFESDIEMLYNRRLQRKLEIQRATRVPKFSKVSKTMDDNWKVAPVGKRLQNRHLDLGDVSPSDLTHFSAALRSPVQGIQVDFDDGHCPTWRNQILGLHNVIRAVRGQLPDVPPISEAPTLMLRPRAWNMIENNLTVNGRRVPGPVFDFSLLAFHNGTELLERTGTSGAFYLSKVEGAEEAKLWNDVFQWTEIRLGFPRGSLKACVLIENIFSAFEMDAILWELRERSLGLNCGIWDYAASIIAKFGTNDSNYLIPDRKKYVNATKFFLKSYMLLVVETCHRRGAHATGGMAANLLPLENKNSPNYRDTLRLVYESKSNEIRLGLDGFMVYDVGLVDTMNELWRENSAHANIRMEILAGNSNVKISEEDLLRLPEGGVTQTGLEHNICVGMLFMFHWLNGKGHFPYKGFVEDSATAEISRSQVWQWIRFGAKLEDGEKRVSRRLVAELASKIVVQLQKDYGTTVEMTKKLFVAFDIFLELANKRDFPEFITTYLYEQHAFRKCQSKL